MANRAAPRTLAAPFVFVAVTLALVWAATLLVPSAWASEGSTATKLLRASLLYAAVVGWQPLAALLLVRRTIDRGWLDRGGHTMGPRYMATSVALPIVLLLGAAIVDAVIGSTERMLPGQALPPTWIDAALALCAFIAVIAVLWIQAIAEEVGWRGYLLPRLMQVAGPWPGLFLHGILWGACYAPVYLVVGGSSDLWRAASFIVTCGLLGILLGWLRLASGSIAASATCNATLTLVAGLPLVLHGMTPMLSAIFEPAGWLPMMLVIVWIASRPSLRASVVTPQRPISSHLN